MLTGALGSGEGDQPEHRHGLALAELLLAAGADPNDGQALYNRQFGADDRHLVLLLEHGLGRGDGGPWRARLGHAADSPAELMRGQLWWAIVHDLRDRVAAAGRARRGLPQPVLRRTADGRRGSGRRTGGLRPRWPRWPAARSWPTGWWPRGRSGPPPRGPTG